jgi:hypothetical protein
MSDTDLANKLADYYLANEKVLTQQGVEEVINKLAIFKSSVPF